MAWFFLGLTLGATVVLALFAAFYREANYVGIAAAVFLLGGSAAFLAALPHD